MFINFDFRPKSKANFLPFPDFQGTHENWSGAFVNARSIENNNNVMTRIQEHQTQISQQSEYGTHVLFPHQN